MRFPPGLMAVLCACMDGSGAALAETESAFQTLNVEKVFNRRGNDLSFGTGVLWVKSGFSVLRIDAASNETTEIPLPGAPTRQRRIIAGELAVSIADTGEDTVFKIAPGSLDVTL